MKLPKEFYIYRTYIYLVIIVFLSLYLFTKTADLPVIDELAELHISMSLNEQVEEQLQQDSPYLPTESRKEASRKIVDELLSNAEVKKDIEQEKELLRNYYKLPSGTTYPYRYDTYYYLRQAQNLLETGMLGEYERENQQYDDLRLAPSEQMMHFNLMPYFILGSYYIMRNHANDPIEVGAFWLPVIFGVLSCVILFFLASAFFGKEIGFISSIVFLLHPATFSIMKGGGADSPCANVFFSLLIVFLFIKVMQDPDPKKTKTWVFSALMLLSLIVFSKIWTGYYYILGVILIYLIALISLKLLRSNNLRVTLPLYGIILIIFYANRNHIYITRALERLNLLTEKGLFPTAWSTVGELKGLTLASYLDHFQTLFVLLALLGLGLLAYKQWNNTDERSFLIIWSLLSILPFMSLRFYPYMLAPAAILFAYSVFKIAKWVSDLNFNIDETLVVVAILVIFIVTIWPSYASEIERYPYVDDAIYEMSEELKRTDAIITTWWDYGYIYEHYADRPVTFDGGAFDPQRLYWVSRVLMSKDDKEASGILRMLNCGGENNAFKKVSKEVGEENAVKVLGKALKLNREDAEKYYDEIGVSSTIEDTHCDAPAGILLLSSDMLKKISSINYFDGWNFKYRVSTSIDMPFEIGQCSNDVCTLGVTLKDDRALIDNKEVLKSIFVNQDFTNFSVSENPDGLPVTALVSGNNVYLMNPGFEETVLIRGLFFNDMENFELFSIKDMRKRIVSYKVVY